MIGFGGAILFASLLGSMHCVGMCGPMALWASGVGQPNLSRRAACARLSAYHLGRGTTFLGAGLAAGWFGGLVASGGDWLGLQQSAARLAGASMIGLGVWKLLAWMWPADDTSAAARPQGTKLPAQETLSRPSGANGRSWNQVLSLAIAARLARLRPSIVRLPGLLRPYAIGLVTTLLPCGWLYLFVLVAAATASPVTATWVMAAFWIGTLPALTALVVGAYGSMGFSPRLRPAMPVLIAAVLLTTGGYTLSGRAAADLAPLGDAAKRWTEQTGSADPLALLDGMSDLPLPCCEPTENPLASTEAIP